MLILIFILLRIFMLPFVTAPIPSYSEFIKSKTHIQDGWMVLGCLIVFGLSLIILPWYVALIFAVIFWTGWNIKILMTISVFMLGFGTFAQTVEIRQVSTTMRPNASIEIHKQDGTVQNTTFKTLPQAFASFDGYELIQAYTGFIGNEQIVAWVCKRKEE